MSEQQSSASNTGGENERLNTLFSELFTKANIEADEYMLANVQANGSYSFEVICRCPKVREITVDEILIESALIAAQNIEFNLTDRSSRPKLRLEQHSIILRDIAPDTPNEAILKIFEDAAPSSEGVPCPRAVSARSDLNNTWFVSFASDDDTRLALSCIRTSRFNGASVKARLKTESLNRAFYNTSDRYGAGASSTMSPAQGDYYSPVMSPMMMQQNMFYGYPGPGAFLPAGYPGMSPMGAPMGQGMWQQSPNNGMMGQGGFQQNNRQGQGKGANMQNNRPPNRNQQQRVSPRNAGGRNVGHQQQGQYYDAGSPTMTSTAEGLPDTTAPHDLTAPGSGADSNQYQTSRHNQNNNQSGKRNSGTAEGGAQVKNGENTHQKKKNSTVVSQNNNSQAQNKRRDNKSSEQSQGGKGTVQNKSGQSRTTANAGDKGKKTGRQEGKGPNFSLSAADFPAAWVDSSGRPSAEQGGQKGSWTAALLGGSKPTSPKETSTSPDPTETTAKNKGGKPNQISNVGAAAKAMFTSEEHHSILVSSFEQKRERANSIGPDQHITFVNDAKDEPSHIHRVPTPIPSEEEVLERWQGDQGPSPPPLHVNDSVAERHSHRIVPGTQVSKELETLLFGSFEPPSANTVEANTNANAVHIPVPIATPIVAAPVPGGKRSFLDVVKTTKN